MTKIKAHPPETAEILETDARILDIDVELLIIINGKEFSWDWRNQYTNFFDALVDIRSSLERMYAFLNANLGTHYVVKNDTESNLSDLGYK